MSALSTLRSYWQSNTTLNAALPVTKVYVDLVPPSASAYPYGAITLVSSPNTYTTGNPFITELRFQVTLWHTDLDALSTLADTVSGQLDHKFPDTATMLIEQTNRITRAQVVNQVYTYSVLMEFVWSYNQSLS